MSNLCVYRHIRVDKNEVFYIGIGNIKRPFSKEIRNNLWKKITSKSNYKVEILASNLTKELAVELECFLIAEYGRKDLRTGTLANLTDGGEGVNGYKISLENKIKQGLYNKGDISRRKKEVYQYTLEGVFIKKWKCIKTAESFYNSNPKSKNIVGCCNNRQLSAYGFLWSHSLELKTYLKKTKKGNIVLDVETGIFYSSLKEAARYLNINYSTLKGRVLKNKFSRLIKV